jgi:anti-sigma B factor antagonist
MGLSLTTRKFQPDIAVIELSGRITLGRESGQIEKSVVKLLNEGVRKIVIDLALVEYIDSTGIGQLAICFGKMSQANAVSRIAGAKPLVLDLFRITRLDGFTQFFPDSATACASLATPGVGAPGPQG